MSVYGFSWLHNLSAGSASRKHRAIASVTVLVMAFLAVQTGATYPSEAQQPASARMIDVKISLHSSPMSDGDRAPYERIVEYFADGVYEASNGAHKIRTVTIYTGGRYADKADAVWVDNCQPSASVSGVSVQGQHINMCDVFGASDFLRDDSGHQGGGYTLAHEFGHYFYSLYDEYRGDPTHDSIYYFPHSTDDPVPDSIMNRQWNAVGGDYKWLNFSVPKNDTRNTAQFRAYGTTRSDGTACCGSGWETLVRDVSEDPRDGERRALAERIRYDDLDAVAPDADEDAAIDLPGTARSDLNIVWISEDVTFQIVIDHSGSMNSENKMENAKAAAKLLVDLAAAEHATIGVIKFDHRVTGVQSLTAIDAQATKDAVKAAIDTIQAEGNTAIGDAAQQALDDLLAFGAEDTNRVVYLLTDGLSNSGRAPRTVIPAYQSAGISIFTFGYGSDADGTLLQEMAQATNGKYYFSPTSLAELVQVFQDAQQQTSPGVGVATGSDTVQPGTPASYTIAVDSTLSRLDVVMIYGGRLGELQLTLVDPTGTDRRTPDCTATGGETLCVLVIEDVVAGDWTLEATATVPDVLLRYRASGYSEDDITYAASATSLTGDVVEYPEPIVVLALLSREWPIAGAIVDATLERPNGTTESILLRDDGVAPDAVAEDGQYSAILSYTENGAYNVTVQFDNSAGTAQLTERSYQPSVGPDGKAVPLSNPIPIPDAFERFARIQVVVANVRPDDHGNSPQDATFLNASNADMPGKIDYGGDVDVFRIDLSAPGEVSVRVTNLALGMDPRLRLIADDMTTVLADIDLSSSASSLGYLNSLHPMPSGGTVYAEVSHRTGGSGGLYDISAGNRIGGDGPAATPTAPPPPPLTPTIPSPPPTPSDSGGVYVPPPVRSAQPGAGLAIAVLVSVLAIGAVAAIVVLAQQRTTASAAGVRLVSDPNRSAGFRRGVLRIGRDPTCEMVLPDRRASRIHAQIVQSPQGYVIEDLQSTNGTKVNGKRVTRQKLYPGDEIEVGDTLLMFWVGMGP